MQSFFRLLILSLYLAACTNDSDPDCSLVDCAGDMPINLEIRIGGVDVLANGTYTQTDIRAEFGGGIDPRIRVFTDLEGSASALLEITVSDGDAGTYPFILNLGSDRSVSMAVEYYAFTDPCCSMFVGVKEVTSSEATVTEASGYYRLDLP